jgi:hypothetical protein
MVQAQRWRLPLRPASLIALLVALGITAAATWATLLAVNGQEKRLLKERTAEVGLVLNSAIATIPAAFNEQATVLRVSDGSRTAYEKTATTAITGQTTSLTYAWLRPTSSGHGFVVLAAAGRALSVGQVIDDDRSQLIGQALRTDKLVTSPVAPGRRLLFALGPPAAPAGTVLYREQMLGPVAPPRQVGTAPFSELEVTLYATTKPDVAQVLVSTTKRLPLSGSVHRQLLDVGNAKWLLAVEARRPLVGSLTSKAPWFTLGVGVLGSLLIAAVVDISARRRNSAIALYETEHQVAETLQRSLLPQLPELAGLDLAARYIASGAGQQVGGDWFDVFPIAGGRAGIVVGDVIGHDLTAASEMAQIRSALRAYAVDGDPPVDVITRLDRLVDALRLTQLVTVFYGVLDPPDDAGRRTLRYSNAGHLPPIVRRADGAIDTIADGDSAVLGAPMTIEHTQGEHVVRPGDVLVLFTDGLVEVPGGSLDDGLARLADTIAVPGGDDAEAMCDQVLAGMTPATLRDDIALLAVRIVAPAEIRVESDGGTGVRSRHGH